MKTLIAIAFLLTGTASFAAESTPAIKCEGGYITEKKCTEQKGVKCVYRFSALAAEGDIDLCCISEAEKDKVENHVLEMTEKDFNDLFSRCQIQ